MKRSHLRYVLPLAAGLLLMAHLTLSSPARAMTQTTAYLCESNEAASLGYYTVFGKPADKVSGPVEQQKHASQWRIDLLPAAAQARITRYSSTLQQIDAPSSLWRMETDPMGTGLIFLPMERAQGTSPEVITITRETGGFVYSTQHVNPFYNRANVFVGQCVEATGAPR
jgi:hypothetical protein